MQCVAVKIYFNPRSHERSDYGGEELPDNLWGFQSTLPREERPSWMLRRYSSHFYFNPRSHERSDVPSLWKTINVGISIHAPTRGATTCRQNTRLMAKFQSTLPREERHVLRCQNKSRFIFQSTLPREERHQRGCKKLY